jgi:hypothetical protein
VRRGQRAALGAAVLLLISRSGVPLYDGLGFPDDPYRYVGHQRSPGAAGVTVRLLDGVSRAAQLRTPEHGPQLRVVLAAGALTGSITSTRLTGGPLAPAGAVPRGTIDSNVYRLAAQDVQASNPPRGTAVLRAAVMTSPAPVIVYRPTPASAWREVPTTTVGVDNLRTPFAGLGDYAVERLPGANRVRSISGSRLVLFAVDALVVLAGAVWLARRFGRRGEETLD